MSRTRPPAFVEALAEELGADLVPMGSAGCEGDLGGARRHRRLRARGRPVRVGLSRTGGRGPGGRPVTSRIDGSALRYNRSTSMLPDLIVAGPSWPTASSPSFVSTAPGSTERAGRRGHNGLD